ncbi:MAG: 3'-5' exonuclease [Sphaerochaeta sp.]
MLSYTIVDSDSAFAELLASWDDRNIHTLAMDFEGEFNLHIYGEHLCLIQLFDGYSYYLVDPFKISSEMLQRFLEDASREKVMFDCASDSALVRKQYGIIMEGVFDIRVLALALGYTGNLSGLIERYLPEIPKKPVSAKKKNQMTNWLKRPLKPEQIQYALSDVEHLFALKNLLQRDIAEQGEELQMKVHEQMKGVGKSKGPDRPGWTKFSSWKYLSKDERVFLKHFFLARDTLARKYNVPAVRILEKPLLLQMAKNVPASDIDFHIYCGKCAPKKLAELVNILKQAKQDALTELGRA